MKKKPSKTNTGKKTATKTRRRPFDNNAGKKIATTKATGKETTSKKTPAKEGTPMDDRIENGENIAVSPRTM